jgi:hypothetical protein
LTLVALNRSRRQGLDFDTMGTEADAAVAPAVAERARH